MITCIRTHYDNIVYLFLGKEDDIVSIEVKSTIEKSGVTKQFPSSLANDQSGDLNTNDTVSKFYKLPPNCNIAATLVGIYQFSLYILDFVSLSFLGIKSCKPCKFERNYRLHFLHNSKTCPFDTSKGINSILFHYHCLMLTNIGPVDEYSNQELYSWLSPQLLRNSQLLGKLFKELHKLIDIESKESLKLGLNKFTITTLFNVVKFDVFIMDVEPNKRTANDVDRNAGTYENGINSISSVTEVQCENDTNLFDEEDEEEDDVEDDESDDDSSNSALKIESKTVDNGAPNFHSQNKVPTVDVTNYQYLYSEPEAGRKKIIYIKRNTFIQALRQDYKQVIGIYLTRKNGFRRVKDFYPFELKTEVSNKNVPYFGECGNSLFHRI